MPEVRLIDKLFTRGSESPEAAALSPQVRRRIAAACRDLSNAEASIGQRMGLAQPPRLLMVDEEQGAIIAPTDRDRIAARERWP